ncbi:MAG: hypothetical protein JNM09_01280 [Blastocatellia bacterium]|nr:hypothetical protein [Blastocatellia bacterium]
MRKVTSIFLLLFAFCLPVMAQEETPEAIAKAYIAASQASDWAKAATYLHPEALGSLKRTFAEILKLDKKDEAGKQLFGLKNNAEFEQLSPSAVFERMIVMLTASTPQIKDILSQAQSSVIGKVPEAPDIMHVVYRTELKLADAPFAKVEVMSLKKSGDTWRLLLSGDLEAAFASVSKALEAEMKNPEPTPPQAAPAKRPVRKR